MVDIPQPSFTDKGFVPPSERDEVLPAVLDANDQAFGGGMNKALDAPLGQLSSSETAAIGNANDMFCRLANGVDPAYSSGREQDAIGRIYFIERNPSLPTVVTATCLGAEGTVIPTGSQAVATDDNRYVCTGGGTIPASGTIDLQFACVVPGPIACPVGTLTRIFTVISGWDAVTNNADGVLGRNVESRAEFEERRRLSVAHNAQGSLPSVLGAVLTVDGVLDAFVTENVTMSPETVRGVVIAPKSLYVAAVGGAQLDVATAIWTKKAPGCGYNGNTTVTVYDKNPAYNPPYPSYSVSYTVPSSLPIIFDVQMADNGQVPNDAVQQIQTAIVNAFAGADGGSRARIGSTIYASRYYSPVALLGTWSQIVSIKIGCQNDPSATFTAAIAGTAMTVSAVASGTIAIGQTVVAPGVLDGTTIVSGSGSSWVVSKTQTVASVEMFGCVADLDDVDADIDQAPTISADNIAVSFA